MGVEHQCLTIVLGQVVVEGVILADLPGETVYLPVYEQATKQVVGCGRDGGAGVRWSGGTKRGRVTPLQQFQETEGRHRLSRAPA